MDGFAQFCAKTYSLQSQFSWAQLTQLRTRCPNYHLSYNTSFVPCQTDSTRATALNNISYFNTANALSAKGILNRVPIPHT